MVHGVSKSWIAAVCAGVASACFGESNYTAERYGIILDRSPFGADPLAIDEASKNQAAMAAALWPVGKFKQLDGRNAPQQIARLAGDIETMPQMAGIVIKDPGPFSGRICRSTILLQTLVE